MNTLTVYGPGGYDPSKPNDNIIRQEQLPDDGFDETTQLRESALAKLQALGLTEAEALALIGG